MSETRDPAAVHLTAIRDLCYAGTDGLPKAFRDGLVAVIDGHTQEVANVIRKLRDDLSATQRELDEARTTKSDDKADD